MKRKRTVAVIYNDIRLPGWVMTNPQSFHTISVELIALDWHSEIATAQQSKAEEGVRHPFRKEYSRDMSWYVGKCISDTTNYEVLEKSRVLSERRPLLLADQISLNDQLVRKLENCCRCQY